MAELVTLVEPHVDREPPTVVIQATTEWEAVVADVRVQACGLGIDLSVEVLTFLN